MIPDKVLDPNLELWKNQWITDMKQQGFKYCVFKWEDFFDALSANEVAWFNGFLKKMENHRISQHKSPGNNYWVVNRDESYADVVKNLIFGEE